MIIAGEWAVLEKGNPALVTALNKRVFVKVKESKDGFIHLSIKDFNVKDLKSFFDGRNLKFKKKLNPELKRTLVFIKSAIEIVLRYLGKKSSFEIESWGKDVAVKKSQKLGFGSSAATVVAVVSALLLFHKKSIKGFKAKERIYKLSSLAHYLAQKKIGSSFDVAASTFGGVFVYQRFDGDWMKKQLEKKSLKQIINSKWPGFYIEKLKVPPNFNLLVGWTQKPSSTSKMVRKFNVWKKDHPKKCHHVFHKIKILVKMLIGAWKRNDKDNILKLLRKNEDYLRWLGEESRVNIETFKLAKLSQIANKYQAAGKLSGAGGGDCGIAVTFDKKTAHKIKKEWKDFGIEPVRVNLSFKGVKEER
jgi:phosphomevalonate kinase